MFAIPDDPVIRCMERTGLPPWMFGGFRCDEDDTIVEVEEEKDDA